MLSHRGDDAILWPFFYIQKKRSWYANEWIKKKRESRAFQVLLNAHITTNRKKDFIRLQTHTHTHTIPNLILFQSSVFKQSTLCMQMMRIFMILEKQNEDKRWGVKCNRIRKGKIKKKDELNRKQIIWLCVCSSV